jgi:hypothetical protein
MRPSTINTFKDISKDDSDKVTKPSGALFSIPTLPKSKVEMGKT